jgi:hypothetical protein
LNDRTSLPLPDGTPSQSALDAMAKTCWRQSHEIQTLKGTLETYRRGASTLAAQNAELRSQVASLRRRRLDRGNRAGYPAAAPTGWVQIGVNACGLVLLDRVVAILDWRRCDAADVSRTNGDAHGFSRGFWWFSPERPSRPLALFESRIPTARDWAQARALVARAHSDEADLQIAMGHPDSVGAGVPTGPAERPDSCEPLDRSAGWPRPLLRAELLGRRWLPEGP